MKSIIGWAKFAWNEVTAETIKHGFEKCGFLTDDSVRLSDNCGSDDKFDNLFNELSSACSFTKSSTLITSYQQQKKSILAWSICRRDFTRYIDAVINANTDSNHSDSEEEDVCDLTSAIPSKSAYQQKKQ